MSVVPALKNGCRNQIAPVYRHEGAAETVSAMEPLPKRREWAARNGADHVLDAGYEEVALRVDELTGRPGVEVAIELAGVHPALNLATQCVRVGGSVCARRLAAQSAPDECWYLAQRRLVL
jgi:threonine dehydrogenase-like Zn-dependent dehydrogenase